MADTYLAMYLTIEFDLTRPAVVVPIRLFAETTIRLSDDIRANAYFTTLAEANGAAERIRRHVPFQVCALLESSLPAQQVILKRPEARAHMALMWHELGNMLQSFSATPKVAAAPEVGSMSLKWGMRRATTPYPHQFVERTNFVGDMFVIQIGDVELSVLPPGYFGGQIYFALTFHHPTGQIFVGKL